MKKLTMILGILAIGSMLALGVCAEETDPTLVTTANGQVQGFLDEERSLYTWLGVPYGQTTEGEFRWKAPRPAEAWEGIFDATQPSPVAFQTGQDSCIGTEDCLNLEIYRPATDEEGLPVMVFFHGGNNQLQAANYVDNPAFAVGANVLVVSLNFRLNVLGFNALPALKTGDPLEDSGNYTVLDIALALDWVKENIAAFGGDGENITIAGSSAGGRDVMAFLISPLFEGKFQKAISYSGGMTVSDPELSAKVIADRFVPLVMEDGKAESEKEAYEWLLSDGEDVKEYLYGLDAARMVTLFPNASIRMALFPHLYADGVTLPVEGFATDKYNSVPIIMFTGTDEFALFSRSDYFGTLDPESEDYQPQLTFANKYGGYLYELFNAEESAMNMIHAYDAPIYLLTLNGAGHTNQRNVLAPGADLPAQYAELTEVYLQYLSNFMRTGDPNGEGLPVWDAWTDDPEQNNTIMLDPLTEEHARIEMVNRRIDYDEVLAEMDADETITPEQKEAVISQSMIGRWFSPRLDEHFGNRDLWDVESKYE